MIEIDFATIRSHLVLWNGLLVGAGSIAFLLGFRYVFILRNYCKKYTRSLKRLTATIFLVPVAVFFLMNIIVFLSGFERTIADSISFGFVAGMIAKLAQKPDGKGNVRLIAQYDDGKTVDVWLDSLDVTIGEARNMIGDALNIQPNSRIAIESGKGSFFDDLTKPLAPLIEETFKQTDFFGFVTMLCFITIREDDKKRVTIYEEGAEDGRVKRGMTFLGILNRHEVKYGDSLTFVAKIAHAVDARSSFNVTSVDKFVAAAPMTMHLMYASVVRLVSWDALLADANISDGVSEAGDSQSINSGSQSKNSRNSHSFFKKRKREESSCHGKPVCHGDTVVLECNEKYMSVTRGWWMAWSSTEPRRSGAFTIEIIEKAQPKFKMPVPNMSSSQKENDNVLKPGDIFRLRSVKFPEFELGLTSVKIRDEYCYLGLRKIDRVESSTEDDSWCMEVRFTFKNPNDLFTKV